MLVMASLLSHKADTMSLMRHRDNKAMSAMREEMYLSKNPGTPARRKHERYKQVGMASLLHTSETWSWTKELAGHAAWL